MRRKSKLYRKNLWVFPAAFVLFTILTVTFDVQPIGPQQTSVGFAAINQYVWSRIGVHPVWYTITEWFGAAAILVALGFAVVGFWQLITRKRIRSVDADLLLMGGFYLLVCVCYMFFETVIINYRPVMTESGLEASYPSSHAMFTICILFAAVRLLRYRFGDKEKLCRRASFMAKGVSVLTITGRLLSGVHWLSDIIGGALLAVALLSLYGVCMERLEKHQKAKHE